MDNLNHNLKSLKDWDEMVGQLEAMIILIACSAGCQSVYLSKDGNN